MAGEKEALVACSDKSLGIGITIWDIEKGDVLGHIPTSASPPHGLACLADQCLVASQISRRGSVAGGVIFMWPLDKPQASVRSYPMEAIGPVACMKNGFYLAGGAPSGNAYVWEVSTGKLLRTWRAHATPITCLKFSLDDSFLISGSEDGTVIVWSVICLLDERDCRNLPSIFHHSSEHSSAISSLLTTSTSSSLIFVSSSLDGSCKVWDLLTGSLLQTSAFPSPVTAIVLDREENMLFSGAADGSIFLNAFDAGLMEYVSIVSEDEPIVLKGHSGAITALAFCGTGLVSASEDWTACLWDVTNYVIIRKFNHQKGSISNLVVIPQSSLQPRMNHQRASNHFRVSVLDKVSNPADSYKEPLISLPSSSFGEDRNIAYEFPSTGLLKQYILDLEEEGSAASLQMRMEKCIASQEAAIKMAKNVMEMNRQLQIRLLDMLECRLLHPPGDGGSAAVRKKKAKTKKSGDGGSAAAQKKKTEKSGDQSLPEQGEGQPEPAGS
ncbi:protein ROOT INITIATION DEFECTIVE 3-like [Diospyros lotus]|uniref:protein ROOT INITIATION DEFECTIVE 3-like n=1 Tax=Diospyros lotus TaxID=55363 RepID=UPI0022554092|nr:protein ROOT INITIATION DEFECTIVE 3-like [Diospyros lotus]